MLQSLAAWLLQDYLGEYVDNLNADQLSIGYGGIELENLFLKKSALKNIKFPVKLVSGVIGRLKLVIPYRNPSTQPWVIQIEKLSLVTEPDPEARFEDETEQLEQLKKRRLSELEAEWKASLEHDLKTGWWSQSWFPSITSSFSTKIVENLQLDIKNVHIRYITSQNCAFGIHIHSLTAQSTNEEWVKSFQESSSETKFKLVELNGLSIYYDDKNIAYDANNLNSKGTTPLFGPINAEARIKRNASKLPLALKDGARFHVNVLLDNLSIILTDLQYRTIVTIVDDINRYFKSLGHIKYRPAVPVKQNPKAWWKFAIHSVIEPIKQRNIRFTKKFICERVQDIIAYTTDYKDHLLMHDGNAIKDMTLIDEIEEKLTYEELAILRRTVFYQVNKSTGLLKKLAAKATSSKTNQSVQPPQQSWSGWAMSFNPYWNTSVEVDKSKENKQPKLDFEITEEEKKFLEQVQETYNRQEELFLKQDAIPMQLSFTLDTGSFILRNQSKQIEVLNIHLQKVDYFMEIGSKLKSIMWNANLGSFAIKNLSPHSKIFPALLEPQKNIMAEKNSINFLSISFGKKKGSRNSSFKLGVTLEPSNVVLDLAIISDVKEFFNIPEHSKYKLVTSSMSQRFQQAIDARLEELKVATKVELVNVLERLTKGYAQEEDEWNINLDIAAPQIIVPLQHHVDFDGQFEKKMMIFNLGKIVFHNDHAKKSSKIVENKEAGKESVDGHGDDDDDDDEEFLTPSSTSPACPDDVPTYQEMMLDETLTEQQIKEMLYDSYTLELNSVQILVSNITDNWKTRQITGFGPDHVVDEFSVAFNLNRRIVFSADPDYPALMLSGVLPQLLIHIDKMKLQVIFSCLSLFSTKSDGSEVIEEVSATVSNESVFASSNDTLASTVFENNLQDLLLDSKLVVAKFTFQKLSLGLHSRGRCFAELQVDGVACEFTKRPYDMSVSLMVSSLLLIDAIQTFGPEYELLISSKEYGSRADFSKDFLINVTYQMVDANSPALDNTEKVPTQVLSVNFNALYVNGNLETIVELSNVLNQVMAVTSQSYNSPSIDQLTNKTNDKSLDLRKSVEGKKIDIFATFKTIDVLLLRTITQDVKKVPQKVAKISVGSLELTATIGKQQNIKGAIGTIVITDRSPTALIDNQIFSVGDCVNTDMSQALSFAYTDHDSKMNGRFVCIRMASAYYTHNPFFLQELSLCAGDFKQYAINLARSLQTAASDMAISIVSNRQLFSNELLSFGNQNEKSTDSIVSQDKRSQNIFYKAVIETPVAMLPKDESGYNLIVGRLGKITLRNEYLTEAGSPFDVHRLVLDFEKINLSVVNFNIADLTTTVGKVDYVKLLSLEQTQQTSIIYNTNLHIKADKSSAGKSLNCLPGRNVSKQSIHLQCSINSPLKLFLSVPIYKQILTTLSFISKRQDDRVSSSVVATPLPSPVQESQLWKSSGTDVMQQTEMKTVQDGTDITANFTLPTLQIELDGELHGQTHGFVNILFDHFEVRYSNIMRPFATIQVTLQDFSVEDLLHKKHDRYRYLVSSVNNVSSSFHSRQRPCSSYPEGGSLFSVQTLSTSLPSVLTCFENDSSTATSVATLVRDFSSSGSGRVGPLISLEITLAEESNSDDTPGKQKRTNINLEVNSLNVVINLQTWVILLDFFGIGAAQSPTLSPSTSDQDHSFNELIAEGIKDVEVESQTDINVNMKCLVVYLNKESYPLAEASLSAFSLNVILTDGNQDINASIGNIKMLDLSPSTDIYKQRLISLGEKAFDFSFYRYGKPDPNLERDHDMDLTLSISAIQYVHTQRFLIEVISFCQHFIFLQEVLGRMRAVSAGNEVHAVVNRAARLRLKVHSEAPILILPRSAESNDLLVANLGKLSVENNFLYASNPKTNGHRFHASRSRNISSLDIDVDEEYNVDRLLDCIHIKLTDMNIFSALQTTKENGDLSYTEQGKRMMSEPCVLELTIERNLEWMFGRQVPDMSITGILSSVHLNLDLSQFSLIMGMLGENLGEPLDTFTAPSSVLIDPLAMASPSKQLWTTMHIKLHLSNVTIEASPRFSFGDIPTSPNAARMLAKFDFIASNLLYESFSDQSKSINLVSTDVLVHDIRDEVHRGILLPTPIGKNTQKYLQFEVHYLDTNEKSHLTFLCNQSKILLEFDFFLETFRFLSRKEENEFNAAKQSDKKFKNVLSANQSSISPSVIQNVSPITPQKVTIKKTFEMKINITESELIVVEDIKDPDTQTVILKTTAVCAYRPDHFCERPVTCSLQSLEVFSCLWSQREDSALSIVDPVAFLVELNSSSRKPIATNAGLLEAIKAKPVLEIQFQAAVNIRVSYHDIQMFMKIIKSAQQQLSNAIKRQSEHNLQTEPLVKPLIEKNLSDESVKDMVENTHENENSISGFELKATSVSVTLIDDAGNNDVPLMDIIFNNLLMQHEFDRTWKGLARCQLDANYYNTRVSAWEPFIESWKFNVHWCKTLEKDEREKLAIKIDAPDRLDMNLTSALVDITKQTANLWSARFFIDATNNVRRRAPFLPFMVRNKTGCKLTFHTIIKSPTKVLSKYKVAESHSSDVLTTSDYEVVNNAEVAFSFEERSKQRHQKSHQLLVHQLIIQVAGYREMRPVTVDRVGQFFRVSSPITSNQQDGVYVVFDISLEGARKVITVKSALVIHNELTLPVELMAIHRDKQYRLTSIDVQGMYMVPLSMINAQLYCRPLKNNMAYEYCSDDLSWREVVNRGEKGFLRICKANVKTAQVFKFCTLIRCIGLPKPSQKDDTELSQPEHFITLVHSVILRNNLPFDLFYLTKGNAIKEVLKSGEELPLHTDNMDGSVEIGFSFENFPTSDMLRIVNDGTNYVLPARVYDLSNRLLILSVAIISRCGALQISVLSPYWFINKTGLPIIIRREDDNTEIAGQFEEHEEARSLVPLPFSYVASEYSFQCQMRVGKNYQPTKDMAPLWSKPFPLEKETQHRTLYLRQGRDRPEKSFNVSIVMTWGKDVFSTTRLLVVVPRFQIDNQTARMFSIAQRHFVQEPDSITPDTAMTCYPGTVSIFHWPRADLDRIVCARLLDDSAVLWSGGFRLDCETTYHLDIKSTKRGNDYFLRVHIVNHNGTYVCTLTDGGNFPPPFRIINLSDVTVFYWQEKVTSAHMRTFVKAKEGKSYVLDEPLLPSNLVLSVYQESTQTYEMKQSGKHMNKLYYHNAIFIAFTHTFYRLSCTKHSTIQNTDHQLVFDVKDKTVILSRKGDHKRSQLWRMSADGNLVHLGSSTLKDTSRKTTALVLDVEDKYIDEHKQCFRLVLRTLDPLRSRTQTWFFEGNYLRCGINGYVAHLQGNNIKDGSPVVLSKINDKISSFYRCITREKLRPGSGVLTVRAYSNGPTQVLEISDAHQESMNEPWVLVEQSLTHGVSPTYITDSPRLQTTELTISLASGIGLSVINLVPEELTFISLSSINFVSTLDEFNKRLSLQIGNLQIDNQLYGSDVPVTVYATPQKSASHVTRCDLRLQIIMERDKIYDLLVFKECSLDVCSLYLRLEDRLLLKLIQTVQKIFKSDVESTTSTFTMFDYVNERRKQDVQKYFFENITFNQGDLNMSLVVTGKLEGDLQALKKSLGIPFVSFDSAVISFESYQRHDVFEAVQTLLDHVLHFYKQTFINQAAVLLGSLDILGNPMGLIQDFSTGVEGLLTRGNLGGLFVNVAHGFSDSAAKMTGVIADGLWSASMDNKFQDSRREALRLARAGSSSSHFSAGLKGLGMGVIGGLTSMVTQPIEGASRSGISGFFTGIGKGIVGTVAKPVAGMLDLASGTAAAVRTTTETSVPAPNPVRLRRNCFEHGGILGRYNKNASEGQEILLQFTEGDVTEKFVSMELIRPSTDKLKALLTNKGVYFVKSGPPSTENIFLHIEYARLLDAGYHYDGHHHGIEIFLNRRRNYTMHGEPYDDRTMVRAESERIATKVCQKMNYMKSLHEESQFAIKPLDL